MRTILLSACCCLCCTIDRQLQRLELENVEVVLTLSVSVSTCLLRDHSHRLKYALVNAYHQALESVRTTGICSPCRWLGIGTDAMLFVHVLQHVRIARSHMKSRLYVACGAIAWGADSVGTGGCHGRPWVCCIAHGEMAMVGIIDGYA
jgi:hypothetical protein